MYAHLAADFPATLADLLSRTGLEIIALYAMKIAGLARAVFRWSSRGHGAVDSLKIRARQARMHVVVNSLALNCSAAKHRPSVAQVGASAEDVFELETAPEP